MSGQALFDREGVVVSPAGVTHDGHTFPLEHILSVYSAKLLFRNKMGVHVIDTIGDERRYVFTSKDNARDFIAALTQVKGSINVQQDTWGIFFWL